MQAIKRYLILPDIHVPFHDKKAINLIQKICENINFQGVIQLGDALDFYKLSRFDKDPNRKEDVFYEIEMYKNIMIKIMDVLPYNAIWFQLLNKLDPEVHKALFIKNMQMDEIIDLKTPEQNQ